jgi:adenylate cyclase, class 2
VFYSRPDQAGPKQSDVALSKIPAQSEIRELLAKALGVLVAVDKRREIYFVANVKIHLDRVEGLGEYVEVEAIGSANEVEKLREQCEAFLSEFGVKQEDLIEGSYSDLLLPK